MNVYLLDALRTPVGRYGGALAGIRPDDLAAHVLRAVVQRTPTLDPSTLDEVYFGDANGAGEDNRNVARMAVLLAGLPTTVPAATVNRLCGSGLEAVIAACRAIQVGDADLAIGGGVESMSRAPWVLTKPERGYPRDHQTLHSSTLGWRMINPRMDDRWTVPLGEGAELLADRYGITRSAQDSFAFESHRRAAAAIDASRFNDEIVPVETPSKDVAFEIDESVRAETTLERLAELRPVFRSDGTVTAGNASPLNDGASACLLASERGLSVLGDLEPLARLVSQATSGIEPQLFGLGPVEASVKALDRAGISWTDLNLVELNEAFAAQSLACLAEFPELDPAIVNVNGGAIALGHPLGASGTRILTTLAWELKRRGGGYGLATMCIGVGQGIAMVIQA